MAEEDNSGNGLHLFGRRLAKIPCYRDSLMNGIGGGIVTGLGFFLFTSSIKRASNVGFGSFIGFSVLSWAICRNQRATPNEKAIREAIQTKILTEGTELEKQFESEAKDV